ncbi:PREDICTED: uncharacterized protein LOC104603903 [Nelumbo nucifera]|uniref:HMA domain-containing protein n=2 Tax=Nelumbo nucifera TaxID=4432 RepID=A0A822YY41_NELNU|nr:PREDICTED: uncharacterized protein LOC104603903 [Nelumbo nucifera]DAD36421.1 TPA_asm: hypothetical protein HUJ06_007062 [Nelumbo nucifera]
MSTKKIEMKVNIPSNKCKTQLLKSVTKLQGIDQVSVDREKGTLTVIGTVDPVEVTKKVRKIVKVVQISSVGPPKKPPSPKKPEIPTCPPYCPHCQLIAVKPYPDSSVCSIL